MSTSDTLLADPPELPRLETWRCAMHQRYGDRLDIRFTNNRRSMVSLQRKPKSIVALRLQKGFEHAPDSILEDLEQVMIWNRAPAWRRVCAFAKTLPVHQAPSLSDLKKPLHTQGRAHDLQELLDEVNQCFFDGKLETRITWGRKPVSVRRRRRRSYSLQFGVWDQTRNLIRIHPDLDRASVPRSFLRYLVYHELCHAACPPSIAPNGQRRIHHERFKALEDQYPDRKRMEAIGHRLFERIVRER